MARPQDRDVAGAVVVVRVQGWSRATEGARTQRSAADRQTRPPREGQAGWVGLAWASGHQGACRRGPGWGPG